MLVFGRSLPFAYGCIVFTVLLAHVFLIGVALRLVLRASISLERKKRLFWCGVFLPELVLVALLPQWQSVATPTAEALADSANMRFVRGTFCPLLGPRFYIFATYYVQALAVGLAILLTYIALVRL